MLGRSAALGAIFSLILATAPSEAQKGQYVSGPSGYTAPASSYGFTGQSYFTGSSGYTAPPSAYGYTGPKSFTGPSRYTAPASSYGYTGQNSYTAPASSYGYTGQNSFTGASSFSGPSAYIAPAGSYSFTGRSGYTGQSGYTAQGGYTAGGRSTGLTGPTAIQGSSGYAASGYQAEGQTVHVNSGQVGHIPAPANGRLQLTPAASGQSPPGSGHVIRDTITGLPRAARDVSTGVVEGSAAAVRETATDVATAIEHPIQTGRAVGSALAHPIQTSREIARETSEGVTQFNRALQSGNGRAVGETLGRAYTNTAIGVAGGGEAAAGRGLIETGASRATQSARTLEVASTGSREAVGVAAIPQRATDTLQIIRETGQPPAGYVGGRTFRNTEGRLPSGGTYREYDIDPRSTVGNRNADRIVVDTSTGRAWYTGDHYRSFTEIQQ